MAASRQPTLTALSRVHGRPRRRDRPPRLPGPPRERPGNVGELGAHVARFAPIAGAAARPLCWKRCDPLAPSNRSTAVDAGDSFDLVGEEPVEGLGAFSMS
jgi:hypothetical protein